MPARLFRDPVHGFIEIDQKTELAVIEHRAFQRLRHIHQLAMANYVYHGADHTRFGHSLGAMEVAGRMFDQLTSNGGLELNDGERDRKRKLVRLAALVHDLGHPPFSHAAEGLQKGGHEVYTERILRETDIGDVIRLAYRAYGIEVDQVVEVLRNLVPPGERYLWQIVSGPIDADKMDYLSRDKLYCGVRYGEFDLPRLVSKLVVHAAPTGSDVVLGLQEGAQEAFEEFFLARYWMNKQVYLHRVRHQLDLLLTRFMKELLPRGYPDSMDQFLGWDDHRVHREIGLRQERSKWARMLRAPRPFLEEIHIDEDASQGLPERGRAYRTFDGLRKVLKRRLGDQIHDDLYRMSTKMFSQSEEEDEPIPLCIERVDEQGTRLGFQPIAEASEILRSFPKRVTLYWIFAENDVNDAALKIKAAFMRAPKTRRSPAFRGRRKPASPPTRRKR